MRDALVAVVGKKGTGKAIRVPGFIAAGKTGTAQKAGENGAGYEQDKYVVSFLGFMPAENPQFVCLVMLDEATVETSQELRRHGGGADLCAASRSAPRATWAWRLRPKCSPNR